MNYYMHSVWGRLKIKTPFIKGNDQTAQHVEKFLRQINGIQSITTNSLTGSIVINYDPKKVTPQTLLDVLKTRGIFDASKAVTNDQYIHTSASKVGHVIYKALLGTIVEQILQCSPLALLSFLI
jgi:copper chaperone CopZ